MRSQVLHSKLGQLRRQRGEPGKTCLRICLRISNVFATLSILNMAQISSVSAKALLLSSSLTAEDCGVRKALWLKELRRLLAYSFVTAGANPEVRRHAVWLLCSHGGGAVPVDVDRLDGHRICQHQPAAQEVWRKLWTISSRFYPFAPKLKKLEIDHSWE